jgi:hypothetical protein
MTKEKGQSLLEVIFSVGVLVMVITAVIALIVKTTGIKSMEFQRKKASEMSEVVIEVLVESKKNDADFWLLNDITSPQTVAGYDGYSYVVDFSPNYEGDCSDTEIECADVVVTINWGNNQTFTAKRFFSKKM